MRSAISCSPRIGIVLFLMASVGHAQQSGFQSGDGQTSVYLGKGGAAAILNLTDTKFSIGVLHRTSKNPFYGAQIFGKASSGVTTFVSGKAKIPEVGGDFVLGAHDPFKLQASKLADDWILLDAGYSRAASYVAAAPEPIDSARRYFDRYHFLGAYNALVNGRLLLGVASGVERRNNLNDLKQVTFQSTLISASSGSPDSIVKTQAGYLGTYRQYVAAPVYTDILFVAPREIAGKYRVEIDGFTRSDAAKPHRSADGGVGFFLGQKDDPTKVIGGVTASWNHGKVRVALVAGFNF